MTEGRERSLSEWLTLLRAGGFRLERLAMTGGGGGSSAGGGSAGAAAAAADDCTDGSSCNRRMPRLPLLVARPLLDEELAEAGT
jgi:hypothetical protein